MTGRVVRFSSRAESLRRDQAEDLRQMLLPLEAQSPVAVRQILAVVDRFTAASRGWTFIMISPEQNRLVMRWIRRNCSRPWVTLDLWAEMFCHLRMDTGEIVMDRKQMMQAAETTSSNISTALMELADFGALIRLQDGREVRWFMNPTVGTHLTGRAREDVQRAAPELRVV